MFSSRKVFAKRLAIFLLASLSMQALAITYSEIGDACLSSRGIITKKSNNSQEKEAINRSIRNLTTPEQLQIIFSLFSKFDDQTTSSQQEDIVTPHVLKDLAVLLGQSGSEQVSLTNILNYCTTAFGEAALASMLAQKLGTENVQNRQAFIAELIKNQSLFDHVQELLFDLRSQTDSYLSLWTKENKVTRDEFNKQYFQNRLTKHFNTNATLLEGSVRLGNALTVLNSAIVPLGIIGANYDLAFLHYVITKNQGTPRPQITQSIKAYAQWINPRSYWDFVKISMERVEKENPNLIEQLQKNGKSPQEAQAFAANQLKIMKKILPIVNYIRLGVSAALHGYQAYRTKTELAHAIQDKNTINYLQTRLIGAATLVNTAQKVSALAIEHPVLGKGLTLLNEFEKLFATHQDVQIDKMISLLQKNTFKGNASFFSRSGRVLAVNKLMDDHKQELIPTMLALGELDACLSVAKMMKEFEHKRIHYCFVNFIEQDTPYLKLEEFWNPFVNPEVVVTNSIELGGNNPRSIIVTGSNTGGKSTSLKAIMTSILLARTFGIAPAQSATMTNFAYLGTSMNVSDNTAGDDSKFEAEVKRAEALVKKVESLLNKFGILIIDELFTGTGVERGAPAAKKVAAYLAKHKNAIIILSTHFPELTTLEQETGLFKNYKVDVYKDTHGNLVRPFKLESGISTNNIADDLLGQRLHFLANPIAVAA